MTRHRRQGLSLLGHRERKHWLMSLLGLITGLEFFENVMFVFGAAHVMGGLDAAPGEFVRVQAAYAVGSLLAIVLQQRLSQHLGYRRYLGAALALFTLGLLGCAQSQSLGQMALSRLVQGAGGGAFFTSCRILVVVLFTPADRPRAVRHFMLAIFGASALAPMCAAYLIEHHGWATLFYAALPPALLAILGTALLMPEDAGKSPPSELPQRRDLLALLGFAAAVICLQWSFAEARFDMLGHPLRLALLGLGGALLLAAFLWSQWRHDAPLLHLRRLQSPLYIAGLGLYFVHYFLSNFSAYLFPIFAEGGLGLPLSTTGLLNSLASIASLLVAIAYMAWGGRLSRKRPLMLLGLACLGCCAVGLSCLPAQSDLLPLLPPLLAKGAFGALLVLPVAGQTFRELGDAHFAHGYQGKNLMRQIASSASGALAAVMLQNRQFGQRDALLQDLDSGRAAVVESLGNLTQAFGAQGLNPSQAHAAALAQLSALVDRQALLLACQDLYRLVALLALLAAGIVMVQRQLR